jgi:hypothetical protein
MSDNASKLTDYLNTGWKAVGFSTLGEVDAYRPWYYSVLLRKDVSLIVCDFIPGSRSPVGPHSFTPLC